MRASGLLVWRILEAMRKMVEPGITTMDLEKAAEKMVADAGARSAFKGYYVPAAGKRFPCVLCTSINEEVIHGVPSPKRVLR
jgi:methionyl aminopeptidase